MGATELHDVSLFDGILHYMKSYIENTRDVLKTKGEELVLVQFDFLQSRLPVSWAPGALWAALHGSLLGGNAPISV